MIVEEACGVDDFVEVDDGLEAEDRVVEDFDDDESELSSGKVEVVELSEESDGSSG